MTPRLPTRCWGATRRALQSTTTATTTALPTTALYRPAIAATQHHDYPFLPFTTTRGVRYGWSTLSRRTKPTRFNQQTAGIPAPTTGPAAALKRKEKTTPVRTGVLAIKKGMTALFTRRGTRIPCTVLQLDSVQVLAAKTRRTSGYWAVQVGAVSKRAATATAPMLGYFEAKGVEPKQHVAEFRVRSREGLLPVGLQLQPDWFHVGQWVDVRSRSRGMGFAGGMKRHGFKGQEASHGNSKNHRTMGSAGASQGSGSRVLPGKKMPGRMGGERCTVQNLSILKVDNELGIVLVKGAVAGPKGCVVRLQDAVKKDPPPQEWVDASRRTAIERQPDHEEALRAARERHLELKRMRKEKSIGDLVAMDAPARGGDDAALTV